MSQQNIPIMEVKDLSVLFKQNRKTTVCAVTHVDLSIMPGETVGLVGESGCGKTTLGRAIKHIYAPTTGEVIYKGESVQKMNRAALSRYQQEVQMIFQDPYSSLDPRMTVRDIIKEGMRSNRLYKEAEMDARVNELLEMVGMNREHARRFPHEFSGGQRQRIGVARALAVNPKFIVCDEPTSALDVSVQAQVIKLFNDLKKQLGLTYLFISHDLAMVKYVSDRVAVMYLGQIVEIAPSERLYDNPQHPYTKALLSAVQIPDPKVERSRKKMTIATEIQSPINLSDIGCRFISRCPHACEACKSKVHTLTEVEPGHFTACTAAAGYEEESK